MSGEGEKRLELFFNENVSDNNEARNDNQALCHSVSFTSLIAWKWLPHSDQCSDSSRLALMCGGGRGS